MINNISQIFYPLTDFENASVVICQFYVLFHFHCTLKTLLYLRRGMQLLEMYVLLVQC